MPSDTEKQLLRLIEISKQFIDLKEENLCWQQISDYMLELSSANYIILNVYDSHRSETRRVALSGIKENIKKLIETLGFKGLGEIRGDTPYSLNNKKDIEFTNIQALSQGAISSSKAKLIQATYEIGQVVIVNIVNNKEVIGNFTLIMGDNEEFTNENIVQLYASQIALLMGRIKTIQDHEKSKKRLENIIEATNIGTWEWNVQTGKIILNERWSQMIGYSQKEMPSINMNEWSKHLNLENVEILKAKLKDVFDKKESHYSLKYRIKHKKGHWVTILNQGKVIAWTKDGEPHRLIGTHLDITENEKLRDEYERFFSINMDLFCIANMEGKLLNVNDSWERLLGYSPDYLQNQNFLDFVHPEDISKTKDAMSDLKANQEITNFVNRYRYCDGSYRYIEWISQSYDNLIYGSGRDITESYERQKEVEFLSFRDYLTGLYNRRYMEDAIKRLDTARNFPLTIMVIDINGLKLTNDAFGHKMGDKLIQTTAAIMQKTCRSDDIIGRMGGDEFLILLPNTDYHQARRVEERMMKATRNIQSDSLVVSFAIGYAVKTMGSQDIIQVEKTADKNMYRHKAKHGRLMRNETIEAVLTKIFHKDEAEQVHAERVSLYCEQIATAMGLCAGDVEEAKFAGILHDIGKISVPDEILNKAGKLTKGEWEEIKRHTITSYNILKAVDEYAALADAYESMTSKRSYKKEKTKEEAIRELKTHSGTQFDSEIVDVFVNKILEI